MIFNQISKGKHVLETLFVSYLKIKEIGAAMIELKQNNRCSYIFLFMLSEKFPIYKLCRIKYLQHRELLLRRSLLS